MKSEKNLPKVISAIYAVSENGVIGKDGNLPWHLPRDLRFFKETTIGKPLIMGRRSFEALGRPLPHRRNIVISKNPDFGSEGIELFSSLEDALNACAGEEEVFISGGAGVYREAINGGLVTRIYETRVHANVVGDTFFELEHPEQWELVSEDAHQADEKHEFAFTIKTLERR